MADKLKASDVEYLKRHAATKTPEELAQRFDTDVSVVRAKLRDLGLAAGGEESSAPGADPALERFETGVKAMYGSSFDKAADAFERVIEESDQPELAERARQYLAICRTRLAGDDGGGDEEPYLKAVLLRNQGRLDEALAIARKGDDDDGRFHYLTASIHAVQGELDEARAALEKAIGIDPKNRVYAFHDPDFTPLRQDDEHAGLFRVA